MRGLFEIAAVFSAIVITATAQQAIVAVQTSNYKSNTTLNVPLYRNFTDPALDTVLRLFLVGSKDVPEDSITCTPYVLEHGTPSYVTDGLIVHLDTAILVVLGRPNTTPSRLSRPPLQATFQQSV